MTSFARRLRSPVITAIVVGLVVGGTTAVAAPTAVTSVVKFAKRATFAKRAGRARRAKFASSASRARRARFAINSNFANNTAQLGGHPASDYVRQQTLNFRAKAGTGETPLLDTGALLISASCDNNGQLRVLATTRVDHADIEGLGNGGDVQDDDFNIAESPVNLGPTQGEIRNIMYTDQAGQVAFIHYMASGQNYPAPGANDPDPDHGSPLGGAVDCLVTGFAEVH